MKKVTNARVLPKVFYGLHMSEGVAEYREPKKEPYRILLLENTIKNMDASFSGRPVYVQHVDSVDLDNIQNEADGYVIESFFNKNDGKHWVKFIVVSDEAHRAIKNGWTLSNAYIPKAITGGGLWHGVEYSKEYVDAEYEHLAIVPNPRYEESIVLTPEEFKAYNSQKEVELSRVANSKGEKSMFTFFKKSKVDNSSDLEGMSVTLPKSKVEKTITQLVEEADAIQNMQGYANGDHMVKVGEEEMSVNDLMGKYIAMSEEAAKKSNTDDKDADDAKKNAEKVEEEKKANAAKAADEAKAEEEKKQNDLKLAEEAKIKNAHFDALKDAPMTAIKDTPKIDLSEDKVARGKARYGS